LRRTKRQKSSGVIARGKNVDLKNVSTSTVERRGKSEGEGWSKGVPHS